MLGTGAIWVVLVLVGIQASSSLVLRSGLRCALRISRRASSSNGGDNAPQNSRPPIIPFDEFAREDIPMPLPTRGSSDKMTSVVERKVVASEKMTIVNPSGWIEDPNRPTGYGRPDVDDDEESMIAKMLEDKWTPPENESQFERWFRETYVGSPYDSRKKKQARLVIKNITFISFGIGFIFTAIWFAFPGKFISVRGERDFTERYATDFVPPQGLLSEEWSKSKVSSADAQLYFDDAIGLPIQEKTRWGEQGNGGGNQFQLAPPPRADL